jgi:hypothetical protein
MSNGAMATESSIALPGPSRTPTISEASDVRYPEPQRALDDRGSSRGWGIFVAVTTRFPRDTVTQREFACYVTVHMLREYRE